MWRGLHAPDPYDCRIGVGMGEGVRIAADGSVTHTVLTDHDHCPRTLHFRQDRRSNLS